jgi:hypothetical protein
MCPWTSVICGNFCFCRQRDLFQVLKAYSILNSTVGFSQAQAPLAAFLLMHMPAEQAFWCLVSICDKYLAGYYTPEMVSLSVAVLLLNTKMKNELSLLCHFLLWGIFKISFTGLFHCSYWGFHSSVIEDSGVMQCDTLLGEWFLTCWSCFLVSFSEVTRWRQYVPFKHQKPLTQWCSVTSKKTGVLTYFVTEESKVWWWWWWW